jgi:acetyl esterase/lipase
MKDTDMQCLKKSLFAVLFLWIGASVADAQEPALRRFPVPQTVSPAMQALIAAPPPSFWDLHPGTAQEWKAWADTYAEAVTRTLPQLREQMGVTVTPGRMGGVPVFTVTPKVVPAANAGRVLLHFHGGGYVLGAGEAATQEAILMAGIGSFPIISVDYRVTPDFPWPAGLDDAMAVYRELLKTTPAEKIGVFGTSAGGGMTLALTLRARAEGLPLPAAIAPGTPWTDLTKTGDSYFTNEGLDNILVGYDGWGGDAARLYAGGHDPKDPLISPVYGDVRGFPPTLLTSGTRDLFLSNTVRMHLKLREAGVDADLIVFEGMSHGQYLLVADAPETRFHFTELGRFFNRHLR